MKMLVLFFTIIFIGTVSSKPSYEDSFVAAVFEHRYAHDDNQAPIDVLRTNLAVYKKAVEAAKQKNADIIVFNEAGLSNYQLYSEGRNKNIPYSQKIRDVSENTKFNPCQELSDSEDTEILKSVSCLARSNEIYIVANMIELQPCPVGTNRQCDGKKCQFKPCLSDGVLIYNTNVVFDRKGNLIAKYHKLHPYFEWLNTPLQNEYVTFDTEFGKFGTFICFDSVWESAIELVQNYDVEHVVFPFFWFEDEVNLSPVEWLQAWALTNKVNFLAANGHFSSLGTLGSGIFSKDFGALRYTYNPDGKSKLMVARVPRKMSAQKDWPTNQTDITIIDGDNVYDTVDEGQNLPRYCLQLLELQPVDLYSDFRCTRAKTTYMQVTKLKSPSGSATVCQGTFCCSVTYEAESMNEDYYLAAFNGLYDIKGYFKWPEESCFVVRCDPVNGKPCVALPTEAKTVFKKVDLRASFSTTYIYPSVSLTKHRLASKSQWKVHTNNSGTSLRYRNNDTKEPLLRLSMMGRIYYKGPGYFPLYGY